MFYEKGSTVACFRGCHFSVTSGVLKVSRFTHVDAQAVVKSRMFGSHCCPMSCLRFSLMKSEKEHVSGKCLRLSNGYASDCLRFLIGHGCPHRSGHMVSHGDGPACELCFLRQCCKRENRFRMFFKGSRTI